MIHLSNEVYGRLISKVVPEECGFAAGKHALSKVYDVTNVNKKKDKFKMGFFSKLKAIFNMMFHNYKLIVIWHVHEYNCYLSGEDIQNAIVGMIYLIIFENKLYFYKVEGTAHIMEVKKISFRIEEKRYDKNIN